MLTRTKDMTTGTPIKQILFFSLPLMIGSVFQQGYMIVDSIIVGRGVGVQALASLGATDWINWLFLWAIHGFSNGFSVQIAQSFGAGDWVRFRKTTAMIVWLCAILATVLTVTGLVAAAPLLRLLHTEATIFDGSLRYLCVLMAGTPAVIAYNMAAAVLRCMGDSRTPLAAMIVAALVNIGLDLLFVLGLQWGIFGAAFATVLAQIIAFIYCLQAMRKMPQLRLTRQDWRPDTRILSMLCRQGMPPALQNGIIAVGGMVLQKVLNGYGYVLVAGFTATNKLYGVLENAAIAFGHAMVAYMGQNSGARKVARIDAGMRSVLGLSVLCSTVIAGTMVLFGRNILSLFVSASEQNAAEVIEIAYHYLFILSCPLLLLFCLHACRSSLQGLGNVSSSFVSGLIELVMRIGVVLLLPRVMGREGVFYAETAAWGTAALYMLVYYFTHIGRIKRRLESNLPDGVSQIITD